MPEFMDVHRNMTGLTQQALKHALPASTRACTRG